MIDLLSMVDVKAALYMTFCTAVLYSYRRIKKALASDTEQESRQLDTHTKILIDELKDLKEQHTNIESFLFDYEQDKESKYLLTYTDGTGARRTAELIKASDKNDYLRQSAEQQKKQIETKIQLIIEELAKIEKTKNKVTKTENKREQRSRKGETGGAVKSDIKLLGEYIKSILGESIKDSEKELQDYEKL